MSTPTTIPHPLTRVQSDIRDLFEEGLKNSLKEDLDRKIPRLFYGKPIRATTTSHFYADKMKASEFLSELRGAVQHFDHHMKHTQKHNDYYGILDEKHIEQWIEMFLKNMEVEHEVA
jgi:hypothetical protein